MPQSSVSSKLPLIIAVIAAAVLLLAGGALYYKQFLAASAGQGTALVGGPFTMTDQNGRRVTEKDFLGRPMLVSFGFTYCPDVCPGQLLKITEALPLLGEKGKQIQLVFVTVDPARDTPQVLKEYLGNFAPGYVGLTGSADDIAAMARAYRVYYAKVDNASAPDSYTMDHSSIIYLMDAKGRFLKHFSDKNEDAASLAKAIGDALGTVEG
jgi:protein SCO1/2